MSILDDLAFECGTDKGALCSTGLFPKCYTKYYSAHLGHLRKEPIKLLEIGVAKGCSLVMWRQYFPNAALYGIDIDPACRESVPGVTIFIGDQEDEVFLQHFVHQTEGNFDVIIDDGGHTMAQQICSFLTLFSHVKPGGMYVIEDLHTSYDERYGGGYRTSGSTVEFLKKLVDCVNRWPSERSIASINWHSHILS